MRQQQHSRQHQRAERIDMPERIEADAALFGGRVVTEVACDKTVGRLVKGNGDHERQYPYRNVVK